MADLLSVANHLSAAGLNFCIVGGYAVALHGAVRGTVDLDLVIEHTQEQFETCERTLVKLGYRSRLPVTAQEIFQFRDIYIAKRNLIAWSFYSERNPLDVIDIIITHDFRALKSTTKKLASGRVPVVAIDDLIAMKRQSGRPQDLEDVKMLEKIRDA